MILDSSLWLEYFLGKEFTKFFKDFEEFQYNTFYVPTIIIYEVHKKISSDLGLDKADKFSQFLKMGNVIDIDYELCILASRVSRNYKLAMADSIIYSTALKYDIILYTLDKHFKGLPNVKYFEK